MDMIFFIAALALGQGKHPILDPAAAARETERQRPTAEAFLKAEKLLWECRWTDAEKALQETNRINAGRFPGYMASVRRRMATIRSRQGRDKEVIALLRPSAQSWRGNLFDCDLAVALVRLGRKDQLRRLYRTERTPSVADVFRDRGDFMFTRGLTKTALLDYREALRLNPRDKKAAEMAARCWPLGSPHEAAKFERVASS